MDEPRAELAACFRGKVKLPDQEVIRLTAAAWAGGDGIAAACGIKTSDDLSAVICQVSGETGAEVLFSALRTRSSSSPALSAVTRS